MSLYSGLLSLNHSLSFVPHPYSSLFMIVLPFIYCVVFTVDTA